MFGFTREEMAVLRRLTTPEKTQDFLESLAANQSEDGHTLYSPRRVLRERKAQCIEGALFALAAAKVNGWEAWLVDLRTKAYDEDHVIAVFRRAGYYGALSKTNHPLLRYRDPVYRTLRELALSYFHEFFLLSDGRKTMVDYSRLFRPTAFGDAWMTSEEDLWDIAVALDDARHYRLFPSKLERSLRRATAIERSAYALMEWPQSTRRKPIV